MSSYFREAVDSLLGKSVDFSGIREQGSGGLPALFETVLERSSVFYSEIYDVAGSMESWLWGDLVRAVDTVKKTGREDLSGKLEAYRRDLLSLVESLYRIADSLGEKIDNLYGFSRKFVR